jgi:hypothetical protein
VWGTSLTPLSTKTIPWLFISLDHKIIQPNKVKRIEKERFMVEKDRESLVELRIMVVLLVD